jgi:hypothetical protein
MNLLEERKRIEKMLRGKIDNFLYFYFLYFIFGLLNY